MFRPDPRAKSRPSGDAARVKQPHWLAVVGLLIAGLTLAGLVSYLGSAALSM